MAEPQPAGSGRLLNVLGLAFGLAGSVGGTIGAGILRTPGLVAAQLPATGWILLIWLIGGLYALLGANCIAELAASLPKAGGWYVYAEQAFGRRLGLVVGWCDWLAHCIGLAWVATTLGEYLAALLPLSAPVLAVGVLLGFSAIQLLGVRAGGASQELLSLAKAVAFIALVGACLLLPSPHPAAASAPALPEGQQLVLPVVLALQAVITTYDGWASPVYFAEEFSDPGRDLPRSLIGGVLAVMALYLLINGALLHVLPISALANSTLPAADAARVVLGERGQLVITAVALLALLGLINTVIMAAPRILYGLGRDGLTHPITAQVGASGTPVVALLITAATSSALVIAGSFEHLLGIGAFLYVALPLSGMVALFCLRRSQPNLPRPYPCWGYPFVPVLVAAVSGAFLVAAGVSDPGNSLAAVGVVGLGGLIAAFTRPDPATA